MDTQIIMDKKQYKDTLSKLVDQLTDEVSDVKDQRGHSLRRLRGEKLDNLKQSILTLISKALSPKNHSSYPVASIAKSPRAYSRKRYNKNRSYRIHVNRAYSGLIQLGYLVEHKKGVSVGTVGKYLTRYRATPKLLEFYHSFMGEKLPLTSLGMVASELDLNNSDAIRVQIKRPDKTNPSKIIKEKVDYIDTEETYQMRENLHKINRVLKRYWFDLELEDSELATLQSDLISKALKSNEIEPYIDFSKRSLYRVFNDTAFKKGGRFYGGWWQHIPSSYRSRIIIDEKKTIEYDYSGLHPAIAYLENGLQPPCESYSSILNLEPELVSNASRKIIKRAFNAMLNAKKPLQRAPRDLSISQLGMTWKELVEKIIDFHKPIEDLFFKGEGLKFQYIDSQLAEEVLLDFTSKGIPILPIHDSFLVHHGHQYYLEEVMKKLFYNKYETEIPLKFSSYYQEVSEHHGLQEDDLTFEPAEEFDLDEILREEISKGYNRRLNFFREYR